MNDVVPAITIQGLALAFLPVALVLGIMLMNQVVFRRREIYEPNRGNCLSCGRCMDYCPVEHHRSNKKS